MRTIEEVKKEFQGTNFHELEEKLKEYGVEAAFKPGKKKKDIIEDAIKLLEEISVEEPVADAGAEAPSPEDPKEEDSGTEGEVPGADAGGEVPKKEAPKKEASKLKVEVDVESLTKDQILKALHNIKLNMISATETQLRILRAKRDVLSAQLEKLK